MKETPQPLPRNLIFFLDGLRYSFSMAKYQWEEIQKHIEELEPKEDKIGRKDVSAVKLLSNIWSFVDTGYRIRELIQHVPGLKKNTPAIQIFVRATECLEVMRHHIQHLNRGIFELPPKTSPLWGTISWVSKHDGTKCYTFLPGTLVPHVGGPSCVYDNYKQGFHQKLILALHETTVEPHEIVVLLDNLESHLKKWASGIGYSYDKEEAAIIAMTYKYEHIDTTGMMPVKEFLRHRVFPRDKFVPFGELGRPQNKRIKEGLFLGVFMLGVEQVTGKAWYIKQPDLDPPDMLAFNIIDKDQKKGDLAEVELVEVNPYSVDPNDVNIGEKIADFIYEKKLNGSKCYPKHYIFCAFLNVGSPHLRLDKIYERLKALSPKYGEVWVAFIATAEPMTMTVSKVHPVQSDTVTVSMSELFPAKDAIPVKIVNEEVPSGPAPDIHPPIKDPESEKRT